MSPNGLVTPHQHPGTRIVVEGIGWSGRTTQLALLAKWLPAAGHRVFVTEWNSSALVKAATKAGKPHFSAVSSFVHYSWHCQVNRLSARLIP